MGLTGEKPEDMQKGGVGKSYALTFLAALVLAYVMARFIRYATANTWVRGSW